MIIYNTLTGRKEQLVPTIPGVVQMFVCGPTVYSLSHIGHAKTYTQFDLIARYLKAAGFKVTYAQNITDVDDKIINRAAELDISPQALARTNEVAYVDDMAALHNTSVDIYGRAHDHIDSIVSQVQALIDRGHAYQLEDGWYYDLTTFPGYGKLSGRTEVKPEDSLSRIDENGGKRNPGDFALWKARKPGEPYWDSPLGQGRPGWHIEDTAITEAIFGPQYDLHGGAVDLIFPHHEAEIAQMEAASGLEPLVRYWMHTGLLRIDGDKMSKSDGNFTTIRDALETVDYRTMRYVFLSHHYRSSMELGPTVIDQARATRRRVENFGRLIETRQSDTPATTKLAEDARTAFHERMSDDFDTPGALAALFDYLRDHNREGHRPGPAAHAFLAEVNSLFDAFDLEQQAPGADDSDIDEQLERRRQLRAERRFDEADNIRDNLQERGITIEDTPTGTRWWNEGD